MTMQPVKLQQPRKWKLRKDGRCCIECGVPFNVGDLVYEDCVVCLHVACKEAYRKTLIELGLMPKNVKVQS